MEARTIELSTRSFETFGEDLACMLGIEAEGKEIGTSTSSFLELKKQFKKLVSVGTVRSDAPLDGNFYIILDQEAFFTIAGVLVVQPEKVVIQNRKHGTKDTAADVADAVGEIGNLLVGAFDRVFRESDTGHGHFVYLKTFIGDAWTKTAENIGLADDKQVVASFFELTITPYGPCKMAVVYPKTIFDVKAPEEKPLPVPEAVVAAVESGAVSESIKKMTQSPAVLPGQAPTTSILAGEIMRKDVAWADPEDTVEQALAKMAQGDHSYLLVGKEQKLDGIISRSDLRAAMSPYLLNMFSRWRRPLDIATLQIRIKWVMTKPVATIRSDATASAIASQFNTSKVRSLVVIDATGKVEGIITFNEIVAAFGKI